MKPTELFAPRMIPASIYHRADAVLKDLGETGRALFVGPFILLYLGRGAKRPHVKLEVHPQTDGLYLAYIENLKKRGGFGKQAMRILCALADHHYCPITLDIDTDFGRTAKQLKEFYSEFDFKFRGRRGVRKGSAE